MTGEYLKLAAIVTGIEEHNQLADDSVSDDGKRVQRLELEIVEPYPEILTLRGMQVTLIVKTPNESEDS